LFSLQLDVSKESHAGNGRLAMSIVLVTLNLFVISMAVRMALYKIRAALQSSSVQQSAYTLLNAMSPKNWPSPTNSPASSKHPRKRAAQKLTIGEKGLLVTDDNSCTTQHDLSSTTVSEPKTANADDETKSQPL
jgi:hypothetical protein